MKKFGLIGKSLEHSFSKKYFTDKFESLGLADYTYGNIEIKHEDLLKEIDFSEYQGLNVTIPYKIKILSLLDSVDEEAEKVGAVNTIRIDSNGFTKGYNTDIYGFKQSIKPFLESKHNRALILGTGGASKAVSYVLENYGIPYLFVTQKNKSANSLNWDEVNEFVIKFHPLIINTTPLGMYPNIDEMPVLPYENMTPDHFLIDLIYNPEESQFLKKGKSMGTKVLNGLPMLKHQAEKSWEIWNRDINA